MFFHLHIKNVPTPGLLGQPRLLERLEYLNGCFITSILLHMLFSVKGSCKRFWCTLAGPALAIAECLPDESADHFISGQILGLQLEILRVHLISRQTKHYRAMEWNKKTKERFHMSKYNMCDTVTI